MNHTDHQQRISLYVDHVLGDKESAQLFAHLSECEECRAFLKISLRIHTHIAEGDLADVPASLDRRVLRSVAQRAVAPTRSRWYSPLWFTRVSIPLPAAASILFLIIIGSLLFSPILTDERQQRADIPPELISKIPPSLQKTF